MPTRVENNITILNKDAFFKLQPAQLSSSALKRRKDAATIIAKCQELLTEIHDEEVQRNLSSMIRMTTKIQDLCTTGAEYDYERELLKASCCELIENLLQLPANHYKPSELTLASASYGIALSCFYLLALSVSLAVGLTFGAWYFGYLMNGAYFKDALVISLSIIGIPATGLGLLSYGISRTDSNASTEVIDLENCVTQYCDDIFAEFKLANPEAVNEAEIQTADTASLS